MEKFEFKIKTDLHRPSPIDILNRFIAEDCGPVINVDHLSGVLIYIYSSSRGGIHSWGHTYHKKDIGRPLHMPPISLGILSKWTPSTLNIGGLEKFPDGDTIRLSQFVSHVLDRYRMIIQTHKYEWDKTFSKQGRLWFIRISLRFPYDPKNLSIPHIAVGKRISMFSSDEE
jgi:hypothetical protein